MIKKSSAIDQTLRLNLVRLEVQLKLAKEHVQNGEPDFARNALKQGHLDATVLAGNYPNNEALMRVSSSIGTIVNAPDIEIVNMVDDLLHQIRLWCS
jgi:hypothetical protein